MRLLRMQFTLRRLMIGVAVFAVVSKLALTLLVAAAPRFEAATHHWSKCRQQASLSNTLSILYGSSASRYPADAIIPGVTVRRTEHGPIVPATGAAAAKMAAYHATRALIYERAKWRPWAGRPQEPPWPKQ
jgi:hypothetical protein